MSGQARSAGRVFIVGDDAAQLATIIGAKFPAQAGTLAGLPGLGIADLAVLDAAFIPLADLVDAILACAARPLAPAVLVTGGPLPTTVVRALLKLERTDVLDEPYTDSEVIAAIGRLMEPAPSERKDAGKLFTIVGAVGGSGATTVAIEMSNALARRNKGEARVCLIDLNLCDGSAPAYCGAEPAMRLGELKTSPDRIDRSLVGALITRVAKTFDLLAAPRDPDAFSQTDPETLLRIIEVACDSYDFVVADLPRHRQAWTRQILQGSDEILVVSELTVPALLAARSLVGELAEAAPEGAPPQIIINRVASRWNGAAPSMAEAEKALGSKAFAGITSDWEAAAASVNLGGPIALHRPRSKIVRDIESISRKLASRTHVRGAHSAVA